MFFAIDRSMPKAIDREQKSRTLTRLTFSIRHPTVLHLLREQVSAQNAQILCKHKQAALTKSNVLQLQKHGFSIDPQTQKSLTPQTQTV
jgi:hypothetical protein